MFASQSQKRPKFLSWAFLKVIFFPSVVRFYLSRELAFNRSSALFLLVSQWDALVPFQVLQHQNFVVSKVIFKVILDMKGEHFWGRWLAIWRDNWHRVPSKDQASYLEIQKASKVEENMVFESDIFNITLSYFRIRNFSFSRNKEKILIEYSVWKFAKWKISITVFGSKKKAVKKPT